jgi:hypothetical protein
VVPTLERGAASFHRELRFFYLNGATLWHPYVRLGLPVLGRLISPDWSSQNGHVAS